MNSILEENSKPGTTEWQIKKPSLNNEVEGFASVTSIAAGESIKFYVRSKQPKFSMSFYRMGWYDGLGGRLMHTINNIDTIAQPEPQIDELKKVECLWNISYEHTIPEDWHTGVYLCKLSSSPDLFEGYIIFVVRQKKEKKSTYLFQIATNTYQAYNLWGGYSLYGSREAFLNNHPEPLNFRARAVSFNRPFMEGNGAGDFFAWEYQFLRWAEKNGLDLAYCSNHNLHEDKELLLHTKAFILPGHDEYWSKEMYDQVEDTLNKQSIGLGFFTANAMYWHVRFEDSFNGKNRNLVCYKCYTYIDFKEDPIYKTNPGMVTAMFRNSNINRPEQSIVGQMYEGCFLKTDPNQDIVFHNNDHWLFKNTGINPDDEFPGILGYEYDRIYAEFPRPENLVVLAKSPVKWKTPSAQVVNTFSNVTVYTKGNNNSVFSAGTSSWSWGLDDYRHINQGLVSEKLQKLTLNILGLISKEIQVEAQKNIVEIKSETTESNESIVEGVSNKNEMNTTDINNMNTTEYKEKEIFKVKEQSVPQTPISHVSKVKLLPIFLISGAGIGFITGYLGFKSGLVGLIIGIVIGTAIGAVVDKLREGRS